MGIGGYLGPIRSTIGDIVGYSSDADKCRSIQERDHQVSGMLTYIEVVEPFTNTIDHGQEIRSSAQIAKFTLRGVIEEHGVPLAFNYDAKPNTHVFQDDDFERINKDPTTRKEFLAIEQGDELGKYLTLMSQLKEGAKVTLQGLVVVYHDNLIQVRGIHIHNTALKEGYVQHGWMDHLY